jgi:hypothetical protein
MKDNHSSSTAWKKWASLPDLPIYCASIWHVWICLVQPPAEHDPPITQGKNSGFGTCVRASRFSNRPDSPWALQPPVIWRLAFSRLVKFNNELSPARQATRDSNDWLVLMKQT